MNGIGKTPLIKLNRLVDADCASIYVKWEGANLTGSLKDRMALSMIEAAEKNGDLKPGGTIIEYTGGSTGSSLAMIASAKGYKCHFVSSDAFSDEKIKTMQAFGAFVEIVPSINKRISAQLIKTMKERVMVLNKRPDTFWINQFNNVNNRKGYHAMANEILNELKNNIDEFVMGVGTGGCFSGNAEVFKQQIPAITCVATEPYYVRALSDGDKSGTHRLEGMGIGFVPDICRLDLIDKIMAVKDEDALKTASALAMKEGIFAGTSSGANVWAAIQRAKLLGPGKSIVTIICDSGLKYLQTDLFK